MRPFATLFAADMGAMARSWVIWIWIVVTVLAGVAAVGISVAYTDKTSFIFSWALFLYLGMGSFVVIAISASATSAELPYVGNSIVSRGVNPIQYVLAKLFSRFVTVLTVFLVVVVPVAFIMRYQGGNNDMTNAGILLGLSYVAILLGTLVMLGVTFSAVISNVLVAFALLGILWYSSLAGFVLSQAKGFSADGLLGGLPAILQGAVDFSVHLPMLGYLSIPMLFIPVAAVLFFSTRDL